MREGGVANILLLCFSSCPPFLFPFLNFTMNDALKQELQQAREANNLKHVEDHLRSKNQPPTLRTAVKGTFCFFFFFLFFGDFSLSQFLFSIFLTFNVEFDNTTRKKDSVVSGDAVNGRTATGYAVENQSSGHIVVDEVSMRDSFCFATSEDCSVDIANRSKFVLVDRCRNAKLIVTSVLSVIEVVRCKKVDIFVRGTAPSVSIDNCSSVNIHFFSLSGQKSAIYTSMSSDININYATKEVEDVNDPAADFEFVECPVPEQFVSKFTNGKLTTTASELYSK